MPSAWMSSSTPLAASDPAADLAPHLENGARRVILSTLPDGDVDRVVLYGVNQAQAAADDRIISAGSASTTAMALALKVIAATPCH